MSLSGRLTDQVTVIHDPGARTEQRHSMKEDGPAPEGVLRGVAPIYEGDVVEVNDPRGGVQRFGVAKVEIYEPHHMEVTWGQAPAIKERTPDLVLPSDTGGREKWSSRDRLILEAIAAVEDRGDPFASMEDVVDETGLTLDQVRLGLRALLDAEYIAGTVAPLRLNEGPGTFNFTHIRLLEDGRVVTGQWPEADAYDGLIAAIDRRAATSGEEERDALDALRGALARVGERIAGDLVLDAIRRLRDGA